MDNLLFVRVMYVLILASYVLLINSACRGVSHAVQGFLISININFNEVQRKKCSKLYY
jgi:hypothetical protein